MGKTIGCVGCGNMGGAIMAGLAAAGGEYGFCGFNRTASRMRPLEEKGVRVLPSAEAVARESDIIFLAVKPYQVADVIAQMLPALAPQKLLVSVAAGISLTALETGVQGKALLARCMPNTPALVGEGVFALCFGDGVPADDQQELRGLLGRLGLCLDVPEEKFTAFSALIGAGPAYVFAMMQGLVQAGVTLGFGHADSRKMVAALFAGSAAMARQGNEHLIQLRDNVCSPAGLTIAGVNRLDSAGLTGLLVEAVLAANRRGQEMER